MRKPLSNFEKAWVRKFAAFLSDAEMARLLSGYSGRLVTEAAVESCRTRAGLSKRQTGGRGRGLVEGRVSARKANRPGPPRRGPDGKWLPGEPPLPAPPRPEEPQRLPPVRSHMPRGRPPKA